jgi:hypothetical protein
MSVFSEDFIKLLPEDMREDATCVTAVTMLDYLRQVKKDQVARASAVERGQRGEAWIFDILVQQLPEFTVERVSNTKWSGDFVIRRSCGAKSISIMLDVKNYINPVPRDEVTKFHRDMEVRKHDAGMLLSLGTRFVGQPDTDSDLAFSTYGAAGRDSHVALVNSTHPQIIVHAMRYLYSLAATRHHVTVGETVTARLQEVRARLEQMGRMRHEIQQLGQTVQSALARLTHDLLDIDVRTTSLLDAIFNDIVQQPNTAIRSAATIEQDMGVRLREATLVLLREFSEQPLEMSADLKYIYVGKAPVLATVTRMSKVDRVTVSRAPKVTTTPDGDFTFKADRWTFDLEGEHNIQLAIDIMQAAIDHAAR